MNREWCPGVGDWAIDPRWDQKTGLYRCYGCLRWVRPHRRGHMVGLVPAHKRTAEQKRAALAEFDKAAGRPPRGYAVRPGMARPSGRGLGRRSSRRNEHDKLVAKGSPRPYREADWRW